MTEAELIEQHIAVNGVTRCPTRYVAETPNAPSPVKPEAVIIEPPKQNKWCYLGGGKHCRSLKNIVANARGHRGLTHR